MSRVITDGVGDLHPYQQDQLVRDLRAELAAKTAYVERLREALTELHQTLVDEEIDWAGINTIAWAKALMAGALAATPEQSLDALRAEAGREGARTALGGVFGQVVVERLKQDAQWGGATHDDTHHWSDWARYINKQIAKCYSEQPMGAEDETGSVCRRWVKIAALAVACLESMKRADEIKREGQG